MWWDGENAGGSRPHEGGFTKNLYKRQLCDIVYSACVLGSFTHRFCHQHFRSQRGFAARAPQMLSLHEMRARCVYVSVCVCVCVCVSCIHVSISVFACVYMCACKCVCVCVCVCV